LGGGGVFEKIMCQKKKDLWRCPLLQENNKFLTETKDFAYYRTVYVEGEK